MTVKPDELTPELFMRLYSVLEMRQQITPDPARAEVLKSLRPLRNDFVHNLKRTDEVLRDLAPMLPELIEYLRLLEHSSLGTQFAKSMRVLSTPEAINDVLLRSIQREEAEHRRAQEKLADDLVSASKEGSARDAVVRAAISGDRTAVNRVMSSIRPLVRRYCSVRLDVHGPDRAKIVDDATDIICSAIEEKLPSLEDSEGILPYTYGIAAHYVAQLMRVTKKSEAREVPGDFSEHMAYLLKLLPVKQREVLLLRVVVGLSAEETAEAVGSTPGAVRIAQHRALAKLRKQIARMDAPLTLGENVADPLGFGKNIAES